MLFEPKQLDLELQTNPIEAFTEEDEFGNFEDPVIPPEKEVGVQEVKVHENESESLKYEVFDTSSIEVAQIQNVTPEQLISAEVGLVAPEIKAKSYDVFEFNESAQEEIEHTQFSNLGNDSRANHPGET